MQENLEATACFAADLRGVCQVNLLPFHRTWHGKLDHLGRAVPGNDTETPSQQRMEELAEIFRNAGLTTEDRRIGYDRAD